MINLKDFADKIKSRQFADQLILKIRQKYTVNDEIAILRQRDSKPEEFAEYNAFVEECKAQLR